MQHSQLKNANTSIKSDEKENEALQKEMKELRSRVSELEAELGKSHATLMSVQKQVKDTEVRVDFLSRSSLSTLSITSWLI